MNVFIAVFAGFVFGVSVCIGIAIFFAREVEKSIYAMDKNAIIKALRGNERLALEILEHISTKDYFHKKSGKIAIVMSSTPAQKKVLVIPCVTEFMEGDIIRFSRTGEMYELVETVNKY